MIGYFSIVETPHWSLVDFYASLEGEGRLIAGIFWDAAALMAGTALGYATGTLWHFVVGL